MNFLFSILFLVPFLSFSQISFQNHSVVDDINLMEHPTYVISADIDNDGDLDFIHTSVETFSWSKNIGSGFYNNGNYNSNYFHRFDFNAGNAKSISVTDIDNDGDIDIVYASYNKISWYENIGGSEIFGNYQIISTNVVDAAYVFTADLDNDGDIDVISASGDINGNKVAWYENIDGQGNFGNQQIIAFNLTSNISSVFATDLDNDGDIDIISTSLSDSKIAWYENTDGQGNFGSQQIISNDAWGASSVFVEDIDNDGDKDVVATASWDGKIVWFENIDGQGNFSSQQIIFNDVIGARSISAVDLDLDGDMDIVYGKASSAGSYIAWHENLDSVGNFGSQQIISDNLQNLNNVGFADIDNDGDIDLFSSAYISNTANTANRISWYENSIIVLSLSENILLDFLVYPTPTENILNIKSKTKIAKIEIYSKLEQKIKETLENKIDISNLTQGLYFVKVEDINGNFGVKKIIKK